MFGDSIKLPIKIHYRLFAIESARDDGKHRQWEANSEV